MAEYRLFKRARKRSTVYWLYFYDHGRRVFRSTGETKIRDAEREARRIMAELQCVGRELTLEAFAAEFFRPASCEWIRRQRAAGHAISDAVAAARRRQLDSWILPQFGKVYLRELDGVAVERWLLRQELANQTRNHILYTLNIVCKEAVRQRVLRENPLDVCTRFAVRAGNYRETRVFALEELGKLFPADPEALRALWKTDYYIAAFLTLATSGARPGEVRALQWRHVLWTDRALTIEQAVKESGRVGETKTGERRLVLLPGRTVEALETWHTATPAPELEAFLFFSPEDPARPIGDRSMYCQYQRVAKELKLPPGRSLRSFRHTYNTMLRPVLPAEALRALTGHADPAMTDRYDHPAAVDLLRRLEPHRQVLEEVLGA